MSTMMALQMSVVSKVRGLEIYSSFKRHINSLQMSAMVALKMSVVSKVRGLDRYVISVTVR
jgi:hypothetical protein